MNLSCRGVLIIESMAQTGGILCLRQVDEPKKIFYIFCEDRQYQIQEESGAGGYAGSEVDIDTACKALPW